MAKVVVALGGNALGKSPEEQLKLVKNTASSLIGLIAAGNQVVISHGNGPQVGAINLALLLLCPRYPSFSHNHRSRHR